MMSIYKVGENLTLNLYERKLLKDSIEVKLPELSYRLLVCLVDYAPNVVSHDILLDYVWQGKIVSEDTIKKRVSRLREVLAIENEQEPIIAERGLGYRLNLSVKRDERPDSLKEELQKPSKLLRLQSHFFITHRVLIGGLFTLGIIAFGVLQQIASTKIQQADEVGISPSISDESSEIDVAQFMGLQDISKIYSAISELEGSFKKASNKVAILSVLSELYLTVYKLHGAKQDDLIQAYQFALKAVNVSNGQPWPYVVLGNVHIELGNIKTPLKVRIKRLHFRPNG